MNLTLNHITFSDDEDIVRFDDHRIYHFAPEISNGTESDIVIVPNIPLFATIEWFKGQDDFGKKLFRSIAESYDFATDVHPFYAKTVHEYLWGTPSIFVSIDRTQHLGCKETKAQDEPEWDSFDDWGWNEDKVEEPKVKETTLHPPVKNEVLTNEECEIREDNMDLFGMFYGRNGSYLDPREIHTGYSNLSKKGLMISWHDQRTLPYWQSGSHCNSLDGKRDPGNLPMNVGKKDLLNVFFGDIGRSMQFKYVQEVIVEGFRTYRFSPLESTFHNKDDNEANSCYCMRDPCLPSGLHDVETVNADSPVILSWPHFLYGDPRLRAAVEGLSPDPNLHRFYMDVQPEYGVQLSVLARFQMNVEIDKSQNFGYFDDVDTDEVMYVPFMWIEEGVVTPSDQIKADVGLMLAMPDKMKFVMALAFMGFGLILLIPEIYFWVRSCCRPSKESPEAIDIDKT